jgi:polysaccharide deacetylase family protein (PEP-CTERM system associated)
VPRVSDRTHVVTIGLEDYYHGATFNRLIPRAHWHRFETRVERSARTTLDLLDEFGVKATFFALGWVADTVPELMREVVERGHDIASKGYYHRHIKEFSREEFREDLIRAQEAIERACGRRVQGYRVAQRWLTPGDFWALQVLAEQGYAYDSSMRPIFRRYAAQPWRRFVHQHQTTGGFIWEVPVSTTNILGLDIPIAGANYFRQFPASLVRRGVDRWDRTYRQPYVMYFHVWELDPAQPRISAAPFYAQIRQYRNLDQMAQILRYYFERYRFTSIEDYLGLAVVPASAPRVHVAERPALRRTTPIPIRGSAAGGRGIRIDRTGLPAVADRTPISIVIPCYNEELILPYLANTLETVEQRMGELYDVRFVLIDDASTDGTWASMERLFGANPNFTLVRHPRNVGVAGGVMTGIRAATTEIVCSIDCDCTYDPLELANMVPLLAPGIDLVTASPYHPDGHVLNVPEWRLFLSRGVTQLYRMVLHQKLYTYTACFRVYRRSAVADVKLERTGFIGVTELLGRLDLAGSQIAEYPATLAVRVIGRSKMRIPRVIFGHLVLLTELILMRMRSHNTRPAAGAPAIAAAPVPPPAAVAARE